MKPKALDLFCCAGGTAKGLQRAGFHVTGIDIRPQPRYCGDVFIQTDAVKFTLRWPRQFGDFDFVWASPPCQRFSDLAKRNRNADEYPNLIEPIQLKLRNWATYAGGPYVIENVEGAPLHKTLMLCGTMFGLRVLRHRIFETNFIITAPQHGKHPEVHTHDRRKAHFGKTDEMRDFVQVTGGGNCSVAAASSAMGIDWMVKSELNEAVPPAYAEYIGRAALEHIRQRRAA